MRVLRSVSILAPTYDGVDFIPSVEDEEKEDEPIVATMSCFSAWRRVAI